MKKVEHGKTFDRNAANPPAFEIFHNTVTEGYPKHWHTAIEIIMPTRGEYEVVVGKDSYNLKEGDIIMINSGVVHGMRFVSQENGLSCWWNRAVWRIRKKWKRFSCGFRPSTSKKRMRKILLSVSTQPDSGTGAGIR